MSDQISIGRDGKELGVFTSEWVNESIRSGILYSSDMAWRQGMDAWTPLGTWPEFATVFAQKVEQMQKATAPIAKKKTPSVLRVILILCSIPVGLVAIVAVIGLINYAFMSPEEKARMDRKAAWDEKFNAAQTERDRKAAEDYAARAPERAKEEALSASRTAAFKRAELKLYGSLNDPHSYELVSWAYDDSRPGSLVIEITYRAKNGFGALTLHKNTFIEKM